MLSLTSFLDRKKGLNVNGVIKRITKAYSFVLLSWYNVHQ